MAGFKHRYLVIKINSKIESAILSNIKNILYRNIKTNFGDYILSLIDTLEVIESYESLGILILRCNLAIYKYLCYTIISTGTVNDKGVRMTIQNVSGILKKAKKRMLSEVKNDIK